MPAVRVRNILTGEEHTVEAHEVITLELGHCVPRDAPVSPFTLQRWAYTSRQEGTDSWVRLTDGLAPYWPVVILPS